MASALAATDASAAPCRLPFDVVLSYCDPRSLPRLSLVCRDFRLLARDQGICRACVARHLGLRAITGNARSVEFWHAASKRSLVRLVVVDAASSLPSLALRHGCSVLDIRRLNGFGSDGALKSYSHVAVPVSSGSLEEEEDEAGAPRGQRQRRRPRRRRRVAAVRFLGAARREVLLLLPPGRDGEEQSDEEKEAQEATERHPIPRTAVAGSANPQQQQQQQRPPPSALPLGAHLKQKLCELVGRAARVDAGTASFYLDEAGGDVASALQTAREDERWAASGAAGRSGARGRWAPLRAFIEAEGALSRA